GTISQDLKTGYLVGATPWKQQVAILVGALVSAIVMGGTLLLLNAAYTTETSDATELPKVTAPADELKGTQVGTDGKAYRGWGVRERRGRSGGGGAGRPQGRGGGGGGGGLTSPAAGPPHKKSTPPQPRLFATLIEGIMTQRLPWGLVILGAVLAIVMQLAGV